MTQNPSETPGQVRAPPPPDPTDPPAPSARPPAAGSHAAGTEGAAPSSQPAASRPTRQHRFGEPVRPAAGLRPAAAAGSVRRPAGVRAAAASLRAATHRTGSPPRRRPTDSRPRRRRTGSSAPQQGYGDPNAGYRRSTASSPYGQPGYTDPAQQGYPPQQYGQPGYPQQPYAAAGQAPVSESDEKTWGIISHISIPFFWFVGPLIGYLLYKDRSPYLKQVTTEALNFSILYSIVQVAG